MANGAVCDADINRNNLCPAVSHYSMNNVCLQSQCTASATIEVHYETVMRKINLLLLWSPLVGWRGMVQGHMRTMFLSPFWLRSFT